MDAPKTRAAAAGYHCAHRSRGARTGRFPASDRIDPVACGNVSGSVLGQYVLARARIANDRTRTAQHQLALCYLSGGLVPGSLRAVAFVVGLGSAIIAVTA